MALLEHLDGDGATDVDEGVLRVVGQGGADGAQHNLAELALTDNHKILSEFCFYRIGHNDLH